MKRTISNILAATSLLLVLATSAQATVLNGWTLDLSHWGAGTYTNIDHLSVSGSSTIIQNTSATGIISVGDTFTETGYLGIVEGYTEPGTYAEQFDLGLNGKKLYLYAENLVGMITKKTSGATPANDVYEYVLLGADKIELDLDSNRNQADGVTATLASFATVQPSGGSMVGFLGGSAPSGTTDMTGLLISALTGVFKTAYGLDLATLPAGYLAFGLLNTHNGLQPSTTVIGSTAITFGNVTSAGDMNLAVVPEPSTFLLIGGGLFGLAFLRRKNNA
jgi:hypothetical protein